MRKRRKGRGSFVKYIYLSCGRWQKERKKVVQVDGQVEGTSRGRQLEKRVRKRKIWRGSFVK